MRKGALFVMTAVFLFASLVAIPMNAWAMSEEQKEIYAGGIPYYDKARCNSGSGGSGSLIDGWYTSGLSEPYILEHWAIYTLKALAFYKGVPESDVLTEEKVTILVANGVREGGDIANTSKFNPMNLGGGEGYEGTTDGRGHFKDFDSMINAYAKQFGQGTQSRLGDVLINPSATYKDWGYAFSHFEEYEGNKLWAEAAGLQGDTATHDNYTNQLNSMYEATAKDYANRASLRIGTDEFASGTSGAKDASRLTYGGGATTGATETAAEPATIFLDPGHGGGTTADTTTAAPNGGAEGLWVQESANTPEREEMLTVANNLKGRLEADGYNVVMSRTSNDDKKNLWEKAQAAIDAEADLAVSLHSTPPATYDGWMVVGQKVGNYRTINGITRTFNNAETATKSQNYATKIAAARKTAEGITINVDHDHTNSFGGTGNISLVALHAQTVPWVYNEIAQDAGNGSVSQEKLTQYENGLYEGIKSLNLTSGNDPCAASTSNGDITDTAILYSWPKGDPNVGSYNPKPEYLAAMKEVDNGTLNNNGCARDWDGASCDVFVATVYRKTVDPEFPCCGTSNMLANLKTNPKYEMVVDGSQRAATLDDLKSGDIMLLNGHIMMYVKLPDGTDRIASASCGERTADHAGNVYFNDSRGNYYVFRWKGGST